MKWAAYLWIAACCGFVAPALAHERATVRLERPADGAVVHGEVEIVVVATAGGAPAEFQLSLNGTPVDETGAVGTSALFTTFRLAPGATKRLVVPVAPGEHTLRLQPTAHADRPEQPIVRRFTAAETPPDDMPGHDATGGNRVLLVVVGGVMLAAGAGSVAYFRAVRVRPATDRGAGRGGSESTGG